MGKLLLPRHVQRQIIEEERQKVLAERTSTLRGEAGDRQIPGEASHPDVANIAAWKWLHQSLKPNECQIIRIPPAKPGEKYQVLMIARIPDTTGIDHVGKMIRKALKPFFELDKTLVRFFFNKL